MHVASGESTLIEPLAAALAPRWRVWSIALRDLPYQVAALELQAALDQFGFTSAIVLGEQLGCVPALVLAAWYPERVGGLVLFRFDLRSAGQGEGIAVRALRDCPPDVRALREAVTCPVLLASSVPEIEAYLATALP